MTNMASGSTNPGKTNSYPDAHEKDNFIRLHSAVQYICKEAIPCITDTIQIWHQNKLQTLLPCLTPSQCAVKGKPRAGKSCRACVAWGNAIEAVYYKPPTQPNIQVPWGNINPTRLHHDIVEVAKAFVLRLVPGLSYSRVDDLDAASVLMLMMNFTEFHIGDASFYGRIKDVAGVRNTLSHMKIADNLFMKEQEKERSFLALNDLLDSLIAVYPNYFQSEMLQKVNKFKSLQVTTEMTTKVLEEKILLVEEDVNELRQEFRQEINILSDGMKKLTTQSIEHKDTILKTNYFDVRVCQQQLHHFYLQTFCKIPHFPGNKSNCLNMDDIYTNLSILINIPKPCTPIQVPLNSHHDIFTRETNNGIPPYRILVLGHPGCGKTSLTLKLAHDWAVGKLQSPLKNMSLLFALNMRWMTPETTLEDAIFQQLLPKDTQLTRSSLREYIETNQSACIILFDSYDEYGSGGNVTKEDSGVRGILLNEYLRQCQVLVTSRFWKAGDFDDMHDIYTQMQITGFSDENVKDYVFRFFTNDKRSGEELLEYLIDHNLNPGIANVPLMTLLFCMCWKECHGQDMPDKISDLFSKVFKLLEKQYIAKDIVEPIDLPQLIINVGDVAFSGMWSAEDKLVFSLREFVGKSSEQIVNDGCRIGLLSIEHESTGFLEALEENSDIIRQSLSLGSRSSVTFFHKSCQEKCAGEYLAHVCEIDPATFTTKLQYLDSARTCMRLEMVLRFACGSSSKATEIILKQLLQVFRNQFSTQIQRYYDAILEPDDTKEIQKFVELCLQCYYERPCSVELHLLLNELFLEGKMLFVGMSPYTSCAVGKYISHARSIKSITVNGIPSLDSRVTAGVINRTYVQVQTTLKSLPQQTLQQQMKHTGSSSIYKLCKSEVAEYFRDWQSSYGINLIPIFTSLHSCDNLANLKLSNVKLDNQMTSLQSVIERGGLTALRQLTLYSCNLTNEQSDHLVQSIPHKLSQLKSLDIRNNKSGLSHMGDCLVNSQIQYLDVSNMKALADDMADMINKLPQYGPRMLSLRMYGNVIDDNTGNVLANVVPCACQLEMFSISLHMMKRNTHNTVINAMQHLTHLTYLYIGRTHYPDDLLQCISNTMGYLPQLHELGLHASKQGASRQSTQSTLVRLYDIVSPTISNQSAAAVLAAASLAWMYDLVSSEQSTGTHVQHQIKRSAFRLFITRLSSMEKMNDLSLVHICLHREDLMALLTLCQQRNYTMLWYSKHLFPVDIDATQYDFLLFW